MIDKVFVADWDDEEEVDPFDGKDAESLIWSLYNWISKGKVDHPTNVQYIRSLYAMLPDSMKARGDIYRGFYFKTDEDIMKFLQNESFSGNLTETGLESWTTKYDVSKSFGQGFYNRTKAGFLLQSTVEAEDVVYYHTDESLRYLEEGLGTLVDEDSYNLRQEFESEIEHYKEEGEDPELFELEFEDSSIGKILEKLESYTFEYEVVVASGQDKPVYNICNDVVKVIINPVFFSQGSKEMYNLLRSIVNEDMYSVGSIAEQMEKNSKSAFFTCKGGELTFESYENLT